MGDNSNIGEKLQEHANNILRDLSGDGQEIRHRLIDNVFSFTSCSGGCGASTLVANLAMAFAKEKFNVLVIDMDICYPVQHIYWGLDQRKQADLYSLLTGGTSLGASLQRSVGGVSVLCSLNRTLIETAMIDTEQVARNTESLLEQASSLFDIVLIDIPTVRGHDHEAVYTSLYRSDFIFFVLSECANCVTNLYRVPMNMASLGIPKTTMQYIFNKRTDVYLNKKLIETNGVELSIILPYDKSVIEAGLCGKLFISDGVSTHTTALEFSKGIQQLKGRLLEIGGTVKHEVRENGADQ